MKLISKTENGERRRIRLVYDAGDGTFVKVWATPMNTGFGSRAWKLTGSHCDENGDALEVDGAFKVHPEWDEVVLNAFGPEDIGPIFESHVAAVVARVALAVANEAIDPAAALS